MSQQPPNSPQPPYGDQYYGNQSFGSGQPPNSPQPPYGDQYYGNQSFGSGQPPTNYPPQQPYAEQPQYGQQPYYSQPQPGMYPPPQPPKKKHTVRNVLIIVAIVLVLACGGISAVVINAARSVSNNVSNAVATANADSTQISSSPGTQSTSAPGTQSTYKVGQVVSVANTWQVTVLSATTDKGGQFNTLQKPGDIFILITVSMKNISSQEQDATSLLQWSLQDTSGQKYNIGIDTNAGATPDGKVEAGSPLKGVLTYEVPANIHSFTLSFQSDLLSTGQTIWDITV